MALVFSGGRNPPLAPFVVVTFWWSLSLIVRRRLSNNLRRRDLAVPIVPILAFCGCFVYGRG